MHSICIKSASGSNAKFFSTKTWHRLDLDYGSEYSLAYGGNPAHIMFPASNSSHVKYRDERVLGGTKGFNT